MVPDNEWSWNFELNKVPLAWILHKKYAIYIFQYSTPENAFETIPQYYTPSFIERKC